MEQKKLVLQPRLQRLADTVPCGARLADVGTDHGYLPIYLLQNGRIPSAIASDIGEEPLAHAVRSAAEYGADGIDFRLCAGLDAIAPHETDAVVIAGMGGEMIAAILQNAPWTRESERHVYILQPMTKQPYLRRWLYENGYHITQESLVRDKDVLYPVLSVAAGAGKMPSSGQLWGGVYLSRDPLFGEYADELITKLHRAAQGIEKGRGGSEKSLQYHSIASELKQMKEEWEKCQM